VVAVSRYWDDSCTMADSSTAPAPPEVKPGVRLDDLPFAQTELEPPYRVLIHNDDDTNPL
jgi:hypothetical protein